MMKNQNYVFVTMNPCTISVVSVDCASFAQAWTTYTGESLPLCSPCAVTEDIALVSTGGEEPNLCAEHIFSELNNDDKISICGNAAFILRTSETLGREYRGVSQDDSDAVVEYARAFVGEFATVVHGEHSIYIACK